ncbi:MAG: hypothetical protein A3I12_02265 [Gammaproteobacteria bacterium RIFCSPLOWO2_02_FULL_38_11]|nr:MAG: hypothetical protein A3B69_02095 [Gammaproteobacteria bacterium RIFCSPHIGHO2_02_FULL_38_33]OGT24705.1 MAG: hypothetical protein A2W47_00795 [Gammaproteobacteria bacterium RIFCSPHIGHO2_12_38_15]OGT66890.1 MAG: hypothetical protein A3I12_02265 [Gammaproteobacteria bacterium RIFCSPLOWO2_02_FULL_38_11]OGT75843.1 MAG: hypothetical protein A3G71_03105 [Gammaproteobacteria bacterium RIFCSPLOWO2_12_FULL_38_14]
MSQSLSQLIIHLIFSTKHRHPFLKQEELRQQLYCYIKSICHRQKCEIISIGGTKDHIHILLNLHKNSTASLLVEEIKKSSSKWIKTRVSNDDEIKNFYWQKGYAILSVSQSNISKVKTYIENQKQHHKKQNFKEELRCFLIKHHLQYNECYLWD